MIVLQLHRPFVLRVQNDDPRIALAIANALEPLLAARDARVRIITSGRGVAGTSIAIGVANDEGVPRWLAPLEVPNDPAEACDRVARFLEAWGFILAPGQKAQPSST